MGILSESCPPLTLSPQGIRIFSVCLLLCPHLVLVLANEFQRGEHARGPGCGVVGWRWHLDHRGVPLPELLQ